MRRIGKYWRGFLFGLGLLPVCCAKPPVVVLPEYQNLSVQNLRLGALLAKENLWIEGEGEKKDSLKKEDPIQAFRAFFQSEFSAVAKRFSAFGRVSVLENPGISLGAQERELAGQEFFPVPVPLSYPASLKDSVDFLLILNKFQIVNVSRRSPPVNITTGGFLLGSNTTEEMAWAADFSLCDLRTGRLAAYGKADGSVAVRFSFLQAAWKEILENLCREIFSAPSNLKRKPPVSKK